MGREELRVHSLELNAQMWTSTEIKLGLKFLLKIIYFPIINISTLQGRFQLIPYILELSQFLLLTTKADHIVAYICSDGQIQGNQLLPLK